MSRLSGKSSENRDNYMEVDETSKPDAGVNLVHLTYYRDFGDIFAENYKPLTRPAIVPTIEDPKDLKKK